jgi:hypothetical protein
MSRPWRLLALGCLLAPACAGEEFTSTGESNSNSFTGSSGGIATGGDGAGLGGAQTVTRGGATSGSSSGTGATATTSGGTPGTGGEPPIEGGADTGTAGADHTGGSGEAGGAGGTDSDPCPLGWLGPTCTTRVRACRELPEGTSDGTYLIDPDGTGPIAAFDATCRLHSSGGWTLILNYVHKGGTNPAPAARKE